MDKEQIEELHKAISKLSEEDQAQIAAAGVLTDNQCEIIKHDGKVIGIAYGGPLPMVRVAPLLTPEFHTEEPHKTVVESPKAVDDSTSRDTN